MECTKDLCWLVLRYVRREFKEAPTQNFVPRKLQKEFCLMKLGQNFYRKMVLHALYHIYVARSKRENPVRLNFCNLVFIRSER